MVYNGVNFQFVPISGHTKDARTLHKELGVGKDFTTWIKGRISKYEFVENEDFKFSPKVGKTSKQGGRPSDDYSLTLDMAKELLMIENDKGVHNEHTYVDKGIVNFNIPTKEYGEKFRSVKINVSLMRRGYSWCSNEHRA